MKTEINRKHIRQCDLAELLNLSEEQVSRKINESRKQDFKRSEMYMIHDRFFPDVEMGYLFESDK